MMIVGLTGSIAMGKTTAANMLRDIGGVAVFCSDEAVRALYGDRAVIDLISRRFPGSYDTKKAGIDKDRLIAEIGLDHEKWNDLEEIIHPFVQDAQQKFIAEQRRTGTKIVVLDIPLLFETGADKRVDCTICVTAPSFMQQQRIAERVKAGRMTEESAAFRLLRQMPDAEKRARADFIVQTGLGLAHTRSALEKIIRELKGRDHDRHSHPSHNI